jgi:hypothetical protein
VSECENLENFFILMPKAALGISLAPFFQWKNATYCLNNKQQAQDWSEPVLLLKASRSSCHGNIWWISIFPSSLFLFCLLTFSSRSRHIRTHSSHKFIILCSCKNKSIFRHTLDVLRRVWGDGGDWEKMLFSLLLELRGWRENF